MFLFVTSLSAAGKSAGTGDALRLLLSMWWWPRLTALVDGFGVVSDVV